MKAPYETLELLIDLQKELIEIRDNLNDSNRKGWLSHRVEECNEALEALIEDLDSQATFLQVTPYPTDLDTPPPSSVE
jgi:hypothetical protein